MLSSKLHEQSVLCACIQSQTAANTAVSVLSPEDFTYPSCAKAFEAIKGLVETDRPVDYLTLQEMGIEPEDSMSWEIPTMANYEYYIRWVKESSIANAIKGQLTDCISKIEGRENPADIISDVQDSLESSMERLEILEKPESAISEAFRRLEDVQSGEMKGYLDTGIQELNRFSPGIDEMLMIGARPSTGKSALGLAIAENVKQKGSQVLYISIEMSKEMLTFRRIANLAKINLGKFRHRGGFNERDWNAAAKAFAQIKDQPMHVITGINTLGGIVATIKKYKKRKDIELVVVDHLHIMRLPDRDRRDLQLKAATRRFAHLSKTLGVSIIVLAQLNRNADMERPRSRHFRDCGSIEEDADNIWLLDRPNRLAPDAPPIMTVYCDKFRNGQVGETRIGFRPEFGCFYDL